MTKLQAFHEAKNLVKVLERMKSLSEGKNQCDKFGAEIQIVHTFAGFYGNSGCTAWEDAAVAAVKKAIAAEWPLLFAQAIARAKGDLETARRAAESEAKEVLSALEATS